MLGLKRFLLADEQSFVPRLSASTDGACGHTGSSAIPPSASLYRERITVEPTEHSGVAMYVLTIGCFWRKGVIVLLSRGSAIVLSERATEGLVTELPPRLRRLGNGSSCGIQVAPASWMLRQH